MQCFFMHFGLTTANDIYLFFVFNLEPNCGSSATGDLPGNKSQKPAISGFISDYIWF